MSHICTFCQPYTWKATLPLLFAFPVLSGRPPFHVLSSLCMTVFVKCPFFHHIVVSLLVPGTPCIRKTAPLPITGVANLPVPGNSSSLSFFIDSFSRALFSVLHLSKFSFMLFWILTQLEMLHLSSLKLQRNFPMFHCMGAL